MATAANKNLLQIIQIVQAELNLPQTEQVLSSSDPNVVKLMALTNACLDELINEYDWQFLQIRHTFNTVPGQEIYPFPADYLRAINGTFFDASNRWPLKIVTPTQWEIINIWNVTASPFERMRIFQNAMNFFPVPTAVFEFVFDYISANCILNGSTGEPQMTFENDSDIPMFDSRLVINFLKYKYIASVGSDTTEALTNYQRRLETCRGMDAPAQRLSLLPRHPYLINTWNIPDTFTF